jgi:hexosaminidase
MNPQFQLLPVPRKLEFIPGEYLMPQHSLIRLDGDPQALRFAAGRFQELVRSRLQLDWQTSATWAAPAAAVSLTLRPAPPKCRTRRDTNCPSPKAAITIKGHDPAGIFYGVCTLNQIITQLVSPMLPCLQIEDWPDIPARGVMLDISRDKVYTQQTLYDLVDLLASWKV